MKTERVRAHQETQAMIQIAQRHLPPIHNCLGHHIRRGWCQTLLAMQANARRDIHPNCLDTNSLSDDEGVAGNEEVLGRDERAQSGTDDYLHIVGLSPLGSQLTESKRVQSGTEYHHYFGLSPLESQSIRAQRETNGNKVGPSPLGSNQQTTRARSGTNNICNVGLSPLESSYATTEPKGDSTRIVDEQPAENPDQLPQRHVRWAPESDKRYRNQKTDEQFCNDDVDFHLLAVPTRKSVRTSQPVQKSIEDMTTRLTERVNSGEMFSCHAMLPHDGGSSDDIHSDIMAFTFTTDTLCLHKASREHDKSRSIYSTTEEIDTQVSLDESGAFYKNLTVRQGASQILFALRKAIPTPKLLQQVKPLGYPIQTVTATKINCEECEDDKGAIETECLTACPRTKFISDRGFYCRRHFNNGGNSTISQCISNEEIPAAFFDTTLAPATLSQTLQGCHELVGTLFRYLHNNITLKPRKGVLE